MNKKIFAFLVVIALISLACEFSLFSEDDTPTPDLGAQQTGTALALAQAELENQQATMDAQFAAESAQQTAEEMAAQSARETAAAVAQAQTQEASQAEAPPTEEIAEDQPDFYFPDPFDDNRNQWILDEYIDMRNGRLQFRNLPQNSSRWTLCNACLVTSDFNEVIVEGNAADPEGSAYGLILDNGTCSSDPIAFIIATGGFYAVLQAIFDDAGQFDYWRPFIDWRESNLVIKGQNAKNDLSATYDFSDEVWITVYINGTQVNRFKAFDSSGATDCVAGLYSESDVDFDNFTIE